MFKNSIESCHSITYSRECVVIQIGQRRITSDLFKLGIVPNKTYEHIFPENIPENKLRHYIRGVFDGDVFIVILIFL